MIIYHGSEFIIKNPDLKSGKKHNDYGQGFYCTENIDLAKEWACKNDKDGFVNAYTLDISDLKVLKLNSEQHTILNWIALLLKNRVFHLDSEVAVRAREYLIEHFAIDTSAYDVIIGYRADDSYFSFADAFINNTLPLRGLSHALRLGKLGEQIVLVSEKAFENIRFTEAVSADKSIYYPKFYARDLKARSGYRNELVHSKAFLDDIFVLDIIRGEMKNDDPRIQRIISE